MHKTPTEAVQLANAIKYKAVNIEQTDIILCPPYISIPAVREIIQETPIGLGAQNVFWEEKGAFTGEVSAPMLVDAGCSYVIIGHSERRQYFGESNTIVNKKLKKSLEFNLYPIYCIGETLDQREAGKTFEVLEDQLLGGLADITAEQVERIIIAYEPVWAIGTGRNATPEQAEEAHRFIREMIGRQYGRPVADRIRIQYGGSVKPNNALDLLSQPDVDGALVGGASLDAEQFMAIVQAAETIAKEN